MNILKTNNKKTDSFLSVSGCAPNKELFGGFSCGCCLGSCGCCLNCRICLSCGSYLYCGCFSGSLFGLVLARNCEHSRESYECNDCEFFH